MWIESQCTKCGEVFTFRDQAMCPNCGAFQGAFVDSRSLDAVKFCKSCKSTNQVGKNQCFECGKSDFVSRLSDVEISATAKAKKQVNVELDSKLQTCDTCKLQISNRAKFCPACGTAIERKVESFYCIECGKENPKNLKKCKHCGEPQATFSEPTLMECTHTDFLPGRTPDGSRICKQCKARISDPNAVESLQIENPSVKDESNNGKYIWGGVAILLIGLILVFASKGNNVGSDSDAGSTYLTSSDTSILNEDGASRIDNAALQRLVVAGGIHPDFNSGDGTLKAYSDALYSAFQATAASNFGSTPSTGPITEADMETQLQPGFGLNNAINNLFPGSAGAVFDEFRAEAARDEANEVTYESYR